MEGKHGGQLWVSTDKDPSVPTLVLMKLPIRYEAQALFIVQTTPLDDGVL